MNLKFFYLFYKRGLTSTVLTFLLNLFILSLVGIIVIGTVIPFNIYAREQLEIYDPDASTVLPQGSMTDLSYEMIVNTLVSLPSIDGRSDFAINIPLIYQSEEGNKTVIFIGISDGLYESFQLNNGEIIGSTELSTGTMNISSEENSFNYTLFIDEIKNIEWEDNILNQIFFLIQTEYQPILFSPIIVGNISLGGMICDSLNIGSTNLLAEVLVFFEEGWVRKLSFNRIEQFITNQEKQVFQHLVTGGIQPNLIEFYSPSRKILYDFSSKIEDQTFFLQSLSIPSFVFALIMIFILEIGAYKLIRKDGEILWARGISIFKLKILYWSLELIIDILGLVFAQIIFSISIVISGLQTYLHFYLFGTFALLTLIFIIAKIYRFLRIDKEFFTYGTAKEKEEGEVKITKRKVGTNLLRNLAYISLSVMFCVQIFRIFEPRFMYPVFSGVLGTIIDWMTYLSSLLVFGYLVLSVARLTVRLEQTYNLSQLVKRLFQSALKKLRIQRIVSVGLFCLIVFLLIFETSYSNYENKRFVNKNQLNDIFYHDRNFHGFDFNNVSSLKETIPEIKEVYPLQTGLCSIIGKNEVIDAHVIVVNGSMYGDKDLGWNHIIGPSDPQQINRIFANFSQKSIIINQRAAEVTGLRRGDYLSIIIDLFLKYRIGYVHSRLDNLTVVAIVDTLPFTEAFVNDEPFVFIDISHVLEIMEQEGLEKLINSFGVDVSFDPDSTFVEKQEKIEQLIQVIAYELGVSTATLDIDSKYTIEGEEKNVAMLLFITFNIVFAVLFLPLFVIVFSRFAVKAVTPSIRQLASRGFSIKKIRKMYVKEIYSSLLSSILIGVCLGLVLALVLTKSMYPWMLLATDFHLQTQIVIRILTIVFGGVLSSLVVVPFVSHPINNIMKNHAKEKEIYEAN